ncbi:MAG: flippase-like domain-containing protein [Phycisphaeraceae bacterium]|nr:flippase-like domain-containing protein [Phycisphaeraceae bacterium]
MNRRPEPMGAWIPEHGQDRLETGFEVTTPRSWFMMAAVFAALFGVVLWLVGPVRTMDVLREVGWLAVVAVGLSPMVIVLFQAGAWSVLSRTIGHRIPFRTLLAGIVVGQSINTLTPSTYVGGEALRVLYVGRRTGLSYTELSGTVLLAKYLELLSFIIFFGFCALVSLLAFGAWFFERPYTPIGVTILSVTGTISIFGILLILALYRHWTPVTHLVRVFWWWRPHSRWLARLTIRARQMEQQVSEVFAREKAAAGVALLMLMGTHIMMMLRPLFFFIFIVDPAGSMALGEMMILFVIGQALLALPLTPGGAGTFDGGMIGAFLLIGIGEATAMAYLFAVRIWDALMIGVGLFIAALAGKDLITPQAAKTKLFHPTNHENVEINGRGGAGASESGPDSRR